MSCNLDKIINDMSLKQKIGQLFIANICGVIHWIPQKVFLKDFTSVAFSSQVFFNDLYAVKTI